MWCVWVLIKNEFVCYHIVWYGKHVWKCVNIEFHCLNFIL